MKKRSISFLLVISLIISLFTVYSFAESGESSTLSDSSENYAKNYLYLKSSFGDEADDLGTMPSLYNVGNSYMTIKVESNGNKYGYYNINDTDKNVYFQFEPSQSQTIGTGNLGYMILEMDFNDLGNLLNTNKFLEIHSGTGSFAPSGGRVAVTDIINIGNDGTRNYVYFKGNKSNKIYIDQAKWVHFRCELSILSSSSTKYNFKFYVGDKSFETTFSLGEPGVITFFRIGSTQTANQIFGLDNVAMYSGPKNYSSYRDFSSVKGALTMKVGAENAAIDNSQIELSNPPLLIDGEIYCPVDAIESYADKVCPDEYTVKFDNVKYIHIDKISSAFGIDAKSYDMGLILVGDSDYFLEDDATYEDIATVMKTFVFNIPTADEFKQIVKSNTNNFDHPYILADQDKFNELRSIYTKGQKGELTNSEDILLYNYIDSYVKTAINYLSTYAGTTPTGSYSGLKADKIPVNANYSKYQNNGYDNGGRVSVPTMPLIQFAFAYQMTGHLNYARAAYDFTLALGEWNHWGPAHFLNCADMAFPVAISYDWLYDAYEQLGSSGEKSKFSGKPYKTEEIATILFTHVIIPGYVQSNNINCPWPGSVESRYAPKTSNWNAVCVSGVVMSALVILEDEIPVAGMKFETQEKLSSTQFKQTITPIESIGNSFIHIGLETYSDYAAKLSSMNLGTLAKYGLDQYFPDGSYVESPGYWSYGTNSFFRLIASLLTATGDDFGFMDAWGIDTTCYFAIHSESSDYKTWNFNDGGVGQQDSSFFFFVGDYYGDEELVKVRKKHLATGKSYSIYDILYYDQSITGEPELTTEYYMEGIDAYSVRSSWDKGAIYAGIIGGLNQVSHGHMDAGSFIYHNKGKIWFHDLGSDNYNIAIGYFSNFKLYRVGAEGHNMISITSEQKTLPYGQSPNANPRIIESVSTPDGGYAVLDMSSSYGSHVISAKRGLLFTDSRSTVVIQDEYVFNGAKTAYWYGHYNLYPGYVDSVLISADGRTAFMISGSDMIRVSIVSDNADLKFEIMDCYTYNLDVTNRTDMSTIGGATTENSRDTFRKLAIKCENVEKLNLAVVIEEVSGYTIGTSYNWCDIDDWNVSAKENTIIDNKIEADFQPDHSITGSIKLNSSDNSYLLESFDNASSSYIGVVSSLLASQGSESSFCMYTRGNQSIGLSNHSILTLDLDVFTESKFIKNAKLGINVENTDGSVSFVPLFSFSDKAIISNSISTKITNSWKHLTVIINTNDGCAAIYIDNVFITNINNVVSSKAKSVLNVEIKLPGYTSSAYNEFMLIDNISLRAFSDQYDPSEILSIISKGSSLSDWGDRVVYKNETVALASANEKKLYTNSDIESAIQSGSNITILRDITGLISVTKGVSVNTNGYRFNFLSSSYLADISNNTVTFVKDSIEVRWHIDGEIITETYQSSSVASFKGSSPKIGVISYKVTDYATGGTGYQFYTTGWAASPGGKVLSQNEMIVSEDNCDFWLINNAPLNCLFVTIDENGKISQYNSEQILREFISANYGAKKIILCKDVEIKNATGLSLSKIGKTIYLNGHTLLHKQNDVHMFNYLGDAVADFSFVGPGNIEVNTSRTMFTSSSSTSDRTSKFGIVTYNVNLITNTQLADLRVGQHRFINSNIYQNNPGNKSLFDLWNKNATITNGVPANLLSISFEGCLIKCENSLSASMFSYTSTTYSEIYINDSVVITGGALFRAGSSDVKLSVSGKSSVIAGKFANDQTQYKNVLFDSGVKTNLLLLTDYLPTGAILTTNYDTYLPYLISNNYARVLWKNLEGTTILQELVAVGVIPKATNEVLTSYLNTLGSNYTYEAKPITSTATVSISPSLKSTLTLFQSMQMEEDLSIYFYINEKEMNNNVSVVRVNGVRVMQSAYSLVDVNGVTFYRYKISSCSPSRACEDIVISVEMKDGSTKKITTSAVSYLESLLSISTNDDEKILAVKILKYIQSAYSYFSSSKIAEYAKITNLIEKYQDYDLVFGELKEESVAKGILKDTVKSVQFNMSASVRIRFNLNHSYTGDFTVTFNGKTERYSVKNGKVNGLNYVEVVMPSTLINQNLTLSNGKETINYGISAYATNMNKTDPSLHKLLLCLSEYSSAAKIYAERKNKLTQ